MTFSYKYALYKLIVSPLFHTLLSHFILLVTIISRFYLLMSYIHSFLLFSYLLYFVSITSFRIIEYPFLLLIPFNIISCINSSLLYFITSFRNSLVKYIMDFKNNTRFHPQIKILNQATSAMAAKFK